MHLTPVSSATLAVALLLLLPGASAGFYTKNSPVLQVDAKNYDRLIAKSNHTTILEFYAPWCGHCQNLKPAYEKAAKNLEGLAHVAAIDCDDDANKSLCGTMGIKGFPTLKIIRPSMKKGGKPAVDDYQGGRTANDIVAAVVGNINNHVQKVTDQDLDSFLSKNNESAKAILFTEKGTTSALLKSIAIDFLSVIKVGQIRSKETDAVSAFGIEKFPSLVLLPGGETDGVLYEGEMKKDAMVEFLSQAGQPNPDPAPAKEKEPKQPKKPAAAKSSSTTTDASTATDEAAKEPAGDAEQKPIIVDVPEATATPIPAITSHDELIKECLTEKSHTCVLAFVPSTHGEKAKEALSSLSSLAWKHAQSKRKLFPFFEVAKETEGAAALLKALDLDSEVEIVAINARRGWWRHFEEADFGGESIERWIDAIRMSEGVKKKLPEGLIAISVAGGEETTSEAAPEATPDTAPESGKTSATEEPAEEITPEAEASETAQAAAEESSATMAADPEEETETAEPTETPIKHGEL